MTLMWQTLGERWAGGYGALFVIVSFGVGCSGNADDQLPTYEASGQLTVNGQAAGWGQVVLHPQDDGSPRSLGIYPSARTAPDGSFAIGTYGARDGAPIGRYTVTVVWKGPLPTIDPDEFHPDLLEQRADRLKGKYADPQSSPLKATISDSSNQISLECEI